MSTQYKSSKDVPTEVLAARLDELADVVTQKHDRIGAEFTMRIPAECDRDADLVMAEAARRMTELDSENDRLRGMLAEKLIDSTMLEEISIDKGALSLSANGGVCRIMADAFGQILIDGNVENYVEASFTSSEHPEVGQIVVTVKKEQGQTPHQLRIAAEADANRLRDLTATLACFALELIDGALQGDSFDGGDIQHMAAIRGLLTREERTESCGEHCSCTGGGFPAQCYRVMPELAAMRPKGSNT